MFSIICSLLNVKKLLWEATLSWSWTFRRLKKEETRQRIEIRISCREHSKLIIKIGFRNQIFKINTLATGHFTPDRLQPGAPRLSNIFLFNKETLIFFLHQQRIVPKMKDRTEQNFQRIAERCINIFYSLF